MRADVHHLRSENAGGTIQRREGLVELSHVSAEGRFAFHQINVETRVGNLQCALNPGDASAHHKRGRVNRNGDRLKRRILPDALHAARDHGFGFGGRGHLIGMHP